jgi:amino acid adenylation domain-containing protein
MFSNYIPIQGAQASLLTLERLYPGTRNNHRSVVVELLGNVHISLLFKSLEKLIARHELLRAKVVEENNTLKLSAEPAGHLVPEDNSWLLHTVDATQLEPSPPEVLNLTLKKLGQEGLVTTAFQLQTVPLWRCVLVKFSDKHYQLLMLFNHIIIDETSIGIIFKDLSSYYNALLAGHDDFELPPILSLSRLNFSLSDREQDRRVAYWRNTLNNFNTFFLVKDHSASEDVFQFFGKRVRFSIDRSMITRLKTSALGEFSLNQLFLAAFYLLLYQYSNETNLCIGITSANRRHEGIPAETMEQLVNCFFNSIPLRLSLASDLSLRGLLQQIKANLTSALKNQLPLDQITLHALDPQTKSTLRIASPFNVMLVVNTVKPTLSFTGTKASPPVELDMGHCKFPFFAFNMDELADGSFQCFAEYNTQLFNEETIQRMIAHYTEIIAQLAQNPSAKLSDISMHTMEDKRAIAQFNQTDKAPLFNGMVPDFYHHLATTHPHHTAIVFHGRNNQKSKLTYAELDRLASQFANYLRKFGLPAGTRVGLCLNQSIDLIIARLAIFQAGLVLVPLETGNHYSSAESRRLKVTSADIQLIVIDQNTQASTLPSKGLAIVDVDHPQTEAAIHETPSNYQPAPLHAQSPSYIMYTSGTTGAPKGILLTHGGYANLLNEHLHQFKAAPPPSKIKIISTASPLFDASLYDPLVAAASPEPGELHLCQEQPHYRYSPQHLTNIIRDEEINYGVFYPELLEQLDPSLPLHYVISMGGVPTATIMGQWAEAKPNRVMLNGYGPTEAGICTSLQQVTIHSNADHTLIGQPINNMRMLILDKNFGLCPLDVPGEIYIAGPGLALGYINDIEKNQTQFITVIFDPEKQIYKKCEEHEKHPNVLRLYASGDRGCYRLLSNGEVSVKFIGRIDRLLKIHGVQINPTAIEDRLKELSLVSNAVVIPNQTNTGLIAYIIVKPEITSSETELRTEINTFLKKSTFSRPSYPRDIVFLTEFPRTATGKIDLHALPKPAHKSPRLDQPTTELQTELQKIWSDILRQAPEDIGVTEDFQNLGGTSLELAILADALMSHEKFSAIRINMLSLNTTILNLEAMLKSPRPFVYSSLSSSSLPFFADSTRLPGPPSDPARQLVLYPPPTPPLPSSSPSP